MSTRSNEELLMRLEMFTKLGIWGDKPVVREARKRFKQHLNGIQQLHVSIRKTVFMIVGSNATDHEYDSLLELYKNSTGSDLNRIRAGLSMTTTEKQIKKYLDFVLSDHVRQVALLSIRN